MRRNGSVRAGAGMVLSRPTRGRFGRPGASWFRSEARGDSRWPGSRGGALRIPGRPARCGPERKRGMRSRRRHSGLGRDPDRGSLDTPRAAGMLGDGVQRSSRAGTDMVSIDEAEIVRSRLPALPERRDVGIGVIGAGFIVRDCHLVAYAQAGFPVVGITSRTEATAREVAAARGVPKVFASVEALLDDPEVRVVDVAVPPAAQPGVIRR